MVAVPPYALDTSACEIAKFFRRGQGKGIFPLSFRIPRKVKILQKANNPYQICQ
jgi:hypothetical protein